MGRGPKPTKGKAKPAVSRQSPKSDNARVRDLEKRLADARERERATGEILQVISNSPADLQPVFDAIVRSAQRLLRAHTSSVFRRLEDEIHLAAYTRINEAADAAHMGKSNGGVLDMLARDRRLTYAADGVKKSSSLRWTPP
jgi:hypothetical protein